MKILIVYAYFETDDARRNLGFFCRHGVTPDRDRQYVVVINGSCSIEDQIPTFENVKILRRKNKGFDFGAWADAFRHFQLEQFDYFFLLNSSVTGPFLPLHQDSSHWPVMFVSMLNDRVKLAGITINVWRGSPIVQSMFLVTDRIGLHLLVSNGIFTGNDDDASKEVVIFNREIRSSHLITGSGFRVDSLDLIHGRRPHALLLRETAGDIFIPGAYPGGHTLEPLDVCFFKTNRGCSAQALDRSMQLADYKKSTVANRCLQDARIRRTLDVLKSVPSAWKSHLEFAVWLTCRFLPQIVVDLGVDYGCSTYAWGASGLSQVIGIDWFKGDEQTGFRDTYADAAALGGALRRDHGYPNTVRLWRTAFEKAAEAYDGCINILHVDGLHTYKALKENLRGWLPKVAKDGIVMIHGTSVFPDVKKRFDKLDYPKTCLEHSTGLGILSKDRRKIEIIESEWKQNLNRQGSELRHVWFDDLRIQTTIG